MKNKHHIIGSFSKYAFDSRVIGDLGAQNRSILDMHEHLNAKLIQEFAAEVEYRRWSTVTIERYNKLVEELKNKLIFGVEYEFYLANNDGNDSTIDADALCAWLSSLLSHGYIQRERGKGQYEYASYPMPLSDLLDTYEKEKAKIKQYTEACGLKLLDDPVPYKNDYGSSLQVSVSLVRHEEKDFLNLIYALLHISEEAQYYINSSTEFDRFKPGLNFMTPTHVSWGINNRSCLIRVPKINVDNPRLEYRLPNSNANLVNVVKVILIAWHLSMCKTFPAIEPIWGNAYDTQYTLKKIPNLLAESEQILYSQKIILHYLSEWFYEQ